MRRLATLALCSALILSACRDESRESLTEPTGTEPEASLGRCQVQRFPIKDVTKLILIVFPSGKLRIEALARAVAITFLWDTCKRAAAQKAAIVFIDRMNVNSSRLRGTQAQQNALKNLILNGVGIPGSVPSGNPGDFGVGFFSKTATEPLVVFTQSGVAAIEVQPGSFPNDMIIRISREPDNSNLTGFDGNEFPPYWNYDATRSDGPTSPSDHVLNEGKLASIGFCLFLEPDGNNDTGDEIPYPPEGQRRIGHNPVPGSGQPAFEILELVEGFAQSPFGQRLAANCDKLMPTPPPVIGGFGNPSASFATAAWRSAGGYMGTLARAVFLPEALEASTLGKLPPPINGRAPSLSLFGVVEVGELEFTPDGDPTGQPGITASDPIGWYVCPSKSCFFHQPAVKLVDAEGVGVGNATILAELFRVEGETLVPEGFGEGSEDTEVTLAEGDNVGVAEFNQLIVSGPGTYRLRFSANGVTVTSGDFIVEDYSYGY
jgi:hypothetical protein